MNTNYVGRRGFLKRTFATCAWLSTTSATLVDAQGDLGWKIAVGLNGFQSGTRKYKKNYPIWEVADFAARAGFTGVELVWDWPMESYPASDETMRVQALRRFYSAFGLSIFSIQLGADGAFSADGEVRRQWLETFRDRIRLAQQLGCDCVGLWPYGALGSQTVEQAIEHLGHSLAEAARFAADHGIIAAFEIEPPFAFNREEHMQGILSAADHSNLKVIYDPSHFDLMNGSSGRPHEMLTRIGVKRIGYVQLSDGDGTLRDGGTSKHLACGDGHIDIATSLRVLREGGFRGWIMMDEWEVPDPYDACLKGMKAVRKSGRG
jgi:sugar phosphate isomerase/epimerase